MKKVKVLRPFQYVLKEENGVPPKGCTLIPMRFFAIDNNKPNFKNS